jgi:hypothetical protein
MLDLNKNVLIEKCQQLKINWQYLLFYNFHRFSTLCCICFREDLHRGTTVGFVGNYRKLSSQAEFGLLICCMSLSWRHGEGGREGWGTECIAAEDSGTCGIFSQISLFNLGTYRSTGRVDYLVCRTSLFLTII